MHRKASAAMKQARVVIAHASPSLCESLLNLHSRTRNIWCIQTHRSPPPTQWRSVCHQRTEQLSLKDEQKQSVCHRSLPHSSLALSGRTKTGVFRPLFRIGGLCNTPCVAVMSIYSAVSPSHESELRNALSSATTRSQWALDVCQAFLHMTVRCD